MSAFPEYTDPAGAQHTARRHARQTLRRAFLLAAGAGFVYALIAGNFRFDFQQTRYAHHILMADALLHGQFHIRDAVLRPIIENGRREAQADLEKYQRETGTVIPAEEAEAGIRDWVVHRTLNDWSLVNGRVYGYWAPLTPAVMVPFVAVFGPGVSDLLINALFGGLNVGLFYWLLRRIDRAGLSAISEPCGIALTVVLAFGTVHFYMAASGRVWFASQVVTLTAVLAALIVACAPEPRRYHAWLAGVCFGLAILGRNVVALLGLFFLVLLWQRIRESVRPSGRTFFRAALAFGLPVILAVGVQGAYNYGRFGDVFDSGQAALLRTHGDPRFLADFEQYGQFHPHFFARNLKYYVWNVNVPRFPDGYPGFDPDGNSLFLITPPLLFALAAWRHRAAFMLAVAAGVLPMFVGLLLFRATGYYQFGNRYLLEMLPLLLLLAAGGMGGRLSGTGYGLSVLAVAINLYGTFRYSPDPFAGLSPRMALSILPALALLGLVMGGIAVRGKRRIQWSR